MGTQESCWNKSCSEGPPNPQSQAQLGVSPDRLQSETAGRGSPGLTGGMAGCPELPQQVLMPLVGSPAVLSASSCPGISIPAALLSLQLVKVLLGVVESVSPEPGPEARGQPGEEQLGGFSELEGVRLQG